MGLGSITDRHLVASTVAKALGVQEASDQAIADRLRSALREMRLLLVLDNFEHVVDAAPLVTDLLGACPGLTILATSQVRLRVSGEREHAVPPLSLLAPNGRDTGTAECASAAMRLFTERAQAVKEDFALTSENAVEHRAARTALESDEVTVNHQGALALHAPLLWNPDARPGHLSRLFCGSTLFIDKARTPQRELGEPG